MDNAQMLSDQKIQDYIDGRLDDRERAAVAAYLLVHPEAASQVETLRRQSDALRGIGQEILDEPVPDRLLEVLRRETPEPAPVRRPRRLRVFGFVEAVAAILVFCVGGAVGWFLHDRLTQRPGIQDLIASSAADFYTFYGGGANSYPVNFPPDRTAELLSWINRSFNREIGPPDLAKLSYEYRGGQLLPVSGGASIGFFQFESPEGARLAVVFWPGDQPPTKLDRIGRQENVAARYWLDDGFSFAVMSDASNPDLESAANAVFTFYDGAFGAASR